MLKAITFDFWQTLYADSEKTGTNVRQYVLKSATRTWTAVVMLAS